MTATTDKTMTTEKEKEKDFTMAPNALRRFYTRLPGFEAKHAFLWITLRSYHNDTDGYAYPSQDQLAFDTGTTPKTVAAWLEVLVDYDLVKIEKREQGSGLNNSYYLKMPIADEADFLAAYPETIAVFERQEKHKKKRRAQRDENMAKSAAKHAEQEKREQRKEKAAARAAEIMEEAARQIVPDPAESEQLDARESVCVNGDQSMQPLAADPIVQVDYQPADPYVRPARESVQDNPLVYPAPVPSDDDEDLEWI
ncbi:helix-turn-helix domain-containing protein [Bacillus sp. UNC438CL73TsuS30]|uniref:helix-turn-helix domain-containing protein n=1 Tax=Bacillus sp. UNC438CL73TsuS30 TaxID=1340434 RepID=UPI00047CBEC3|nr:helix-turn-helix domain-containing protein [Bacillus sp. UNC438CL73TsuS30]